MKNAYLKLLFMALTLAFSNAALAVSSSCSEYTVPSSYPVQPGLIHSISSSSSDWWAGSNTMRRHTLLSSSFTFNNSAEIDLRPTGPQSVSDSLGGPVLSAGTYILDGNADTGYNSFAGFIILTAASCPTLQITYAVPGRASVDINPSPAYEGDSVNFAWGTSGGGAADYCTHVESNTNLSATGSQNLTVDTSFSGQYSVNCTNFLGTGSTGNDTLTVYPLPTSVTVATSTGVIGYIDRFLNMPSIQFSAAVSPGGIPTQDITYHWYMELRYNVDGSNFYKRFPTSGTGNVTGNNTWTPNWNGAFVGGNNLSVYVSASVNSSTTATSNNYGWSIHGQDPIAAQITSYANGHTQSTWFLTRMIKQESSNRQFKNSIGLPLYSTGGGNGYGLMQIDNPPPSPVAKWHWQLNIDGGLNILWGKKAQGKEATWGPLIFHSTGKCQVLLSRYRQKQ